MNTVAMVTKSRLRRSNIFLLNNHRMIGNSAADMLLFPDDQTILSNLKSGLQMDFLSLDRFGIDFEFQISTLKASVMTFHAADPIRAKIVVDDKF